MSSRSADRQPPPQIHTYKKKKTSDGGGDEHWRATQSTADSSSNNSFVWLTGATLAPTRLPLACILSARDFFCSSTMAGNGGGLRSTVCTILCLALACAVVANLSLLAAQAVLDADHWLGNLLLNLLGYSTVFLPGYVVIRYVRANEKRLEATGGHTPIARLIRLCVFGSEETIDDAIKSETDQQQQQLRRQRSERRQAVKLLVCFVGLQVSYLTWGFLQEKIMTRKYRNSAGEESKFKDSQFLVFVNRILAFAISLLVITVAPAMSRHRVPIYKYSYSSLSNIMSSWFQYEALKFISFPTQVMAKASKIIPVMIMGRVVSGRKYEFYEYVVALLISLGMTLFLLGSQADRAGATSVTTFTGFILLVGYLTCDSFTSNWQERLKKSYDPNPIQMMCCSNFFSCLLTVSALLQQGTLVKSLEFMAAFPQFGWDCIVLSLCSAVGQLFIFYTITEFGAVVFAIITTVRQAMAILISCVYYGHPVTATGALGVLVVFGAVFLKVYCGHRLRKLKLAAAPATPALTPVKGGESNG